MGWLSKRVEEDCVGVYDYPGTRWLGRNYTTFYHTSPSKYFLTRTGKRMTVVSHCPVKRQPLAPGSNARATVGKRGHMDRAESILSFLQTSKSRRNTQCQEVRTRRRTHLVHKCIADYTSSTRIGKSKRSSLRARS